MIMKNLKVEKEAVKEVDKFEFVDLGLSVKWANMNVGANKNVEYGKYYAWNDIDFDEIGRIPSEKEMIELVEKCKWEWIEKEGRVGYMVSSKIDEKKSIFLPLPGLIAGDKLYFGSKVGYYLTSSFKSNPDGALELVISRRNIGMYLAGFYKRSIRLVSDK